MTDDAGVERGALDEGALENAAWALFHLTHAPHGEGLAPHRPATGPCTYCYTLGRTVLAALSTTPSHDSDSLREALVECRDVLAEAGRACHQNGQLFTRGVMHPGSWERCEAMLCKAERAAIARADSELGEA